MQVDAWVRKLLDDEIQPVGLVQLLDLRLETEGLEDHPGGFGKAVDVAGEVGGNVFRVRQQFLEGVGTDVVERMIAPLTGLARQNLVQGIALQTARLKLFVLLQYLLFGGREHTIQTAQHRHGQHDFPILRGAVGAAELIGDIEDEIDEVGGVGGHLCPYCVSTLKKVDGAVC